MLDSFHYSVVINLYNTPDLEIPMENLTPVIAKNPPQNKF